MCDQCWDADKKAEKLLRNEVCDGELVPTMTLNQLKTNLFQEWLDTGKTKFRIYKDAIFDPPRTNFTWVAVKAGRDGLVAEKQDRISVNFL